MGFEIEIRFWFTSHVDILRSGLKFWIPGSGLEFLISLFRIGIRDWTLGLWDSASGFWFVIEIFHFGFDIGIRDEVMEILNSWSNFKMWFAIWERDKNFGFLDLIYSILTLYIFGKNLVDWSRDSTGMNFKIPEPWVSACARDIRGHSRFN